jgi:hypothetical protein
MRIAAWSVWFDLRGAPVNWDFLFSASEHHALTIDGRIFLAWTEQIVVLSLAAWRAWFVFDKILRLGAVNFVIMNECGFLRFALSAWTAFFCSLVVLSCLLVLHSDSHLTLFDWDVNNFDITWLWINFNVILCSYEFGLLTLKLLIDLLEERRRRSLLGLFWLSVVSSSQHFFLLFLKLFWRLSHIF